MPVVIPDLIEGTTAQSDSSGLSVTRVYYVDVSDIAGLSADRKVVEALKTAGVAKYGDTHPSYPTLSVVSAKGDVWTHNQIKVTVQYVTVNVELVPDETRPALQNVGTSSQEIETNVDKNGAPISVTYTDPVTGEVFNVGGRVKVFAPLTIVKFKRLELNSPLVKSTQYGSTINTSTWMGYPPRTWLCTRIDGERQQNGGLAMYMVSYEFQYKPSTYRVAALYTKPDGSFPKLTPADLVAQNGITYVDAVRETDFNVLRLV